jgi:hypothetical protein
MSGFFDSLIRQDNDPRSITQVRGCVPLSSFLCRWERVPALTSSSIRLWLNERVCDAFEWRSSFQNDLQPNQLDSHKLDSRKEILWKRIIFSLIRVFVDWQHVWIEKPHMKNK